jgi:tetratricopeptide (TPR) repeat protein
MSHDDRPGAEALDRYINQRRAGKAHTANSDETAQAAQLLDLAESLQPDAAFLARLEARLQQPAPGLNGHTQEEPTMTTATLRHRPIPRLNLSPYLLAGTIVLLAVVIGGLIPLNLAPPPLSTSAPILLGQPVTGDRLEYGGALTDFNPATLERLRAAGMEWLSVTIPLQSDYTRDGSSYQIHKGITLGLAQTVITAAHGSGFKIALTIVGTRDDLVLPNSPGNADGVSFFMPMIDLFADVARLGPDAIQVWQEPNTDRFWPTDLIDGQTYAAFHLGVTYDAIKAANPDVLVIAAAPTPTDFGDAFPGQIVNDDVFYQQMGTVMTQRRVADCIGMYYNQGMVPPDQTSGDPRSDAGYFYLPTMLERAYGPFRGTGLPLCITALGYLSADGLAEPMTLPFSYPNEISAAEQAQWSAEALRYLHTQTIAPVRLALLSPMVALPGDSLGQAEAIIRPDGSCPTCEAIAAIDWPTLPSTAISNTLQQAAVTYVAGDLLAADRLYAQAVAEQPANLEALLGYGRTLLDLNRAADPANGRDPSDVELALALGERAITLAPDDARAYALKAEALFWQGDAEAALVTARQGLERDAASSQLQAVMAWASASLSRFQEGLEWAERAIQSNPRNPYAQRAYAFALSSLGRREESIQVLNTALQLNPNLPATYFELALQYRSMGQPAQAIETYQARLRLQPDGWARLGLCETYFSMGDSEQAIGECQEALYTLENHPTPGLAAQAHRQLGMIEYARRNYLLAITEFDRCEELGSTEIQCYYLRGLAHAYLAQPGNGQCELAWEYLNRSLDKVGSGPDSQMIEQDIRLGIELLGNACPQFSQEPVTMTSVPGATATP